jgi:hypothetical protein
MKILLAVDGSPCSDKAVEEIARSSWPAQSEIKVLTAIELPIPSTPEPGRFRRAIWKSWIEPHRIKPVRSWNERSRN